MHFSTMNSYQDIMTYPNMKNWMRFLFIDQIFDSFPDEYKELPLRTSAYWIKSTGNVDMHALTDHFVDTANLVLDIWNGKRECLRLSDWKTWEPTDDAEVNDPDNSFLITPGKICETKTYNDSSMKPAMVICPGGGYSHVCFRNEGTPVAKLAELKGYRCFILNYRKEEHAVYPNPQMDLLRSIQYVREHAEDYRVDPAKVVALGFSAGGHLAASAAGVADELLSTGKPDAIVLGYPVISLKDGITHQGTKDNLVGQDTELQKKLSVEELVKPDYPMTFAWACEDDESVPCQNTKLLEEALEKNKVKHECHYYPQGGHGCGLAYDNSACKWSDEMFTFLEKYLI